jgi:hypothetical protein
VETEKVKQPVEQKKRTRTTRQATQTQPALLAADVFAAALKAIPADDWCRTWAACRAIMLRRTSKRVKEECCRNADLEESQRGMLPQCASLAHLDLSEQ